MALTYDELMAAAVAMKRKAQRRIDMLKELKAEAESNGGQTASNGSGVKTHSTDELKQMVRDLFSDGQQRGTKVTTEAINEKHGTDYTMEYMSNFLSKNCKHFLEKEKIGGKSIFHLIPGHEEVTEKGLRTTEGY